MNFLLDLMRSPGSADTDCCSPVGDVGDVGDAASSETDALLDTPTFIAERDVQ